MNILIKFSITIVQTLKKISQHNHLTCTVHVMHFSDFTTRTIFKFLLKCEEIPPPLSDVINFFSAVHCKKYHNFNLFVMNAVSAMHYYIKQESKKKKTHWVVNNNLKITLARNLKHFQLQCSKKCSKQERTVPYYMYLKFKCKFKTCASKLYFHRN